MITTDPPPECTSRPDRVQNRTIAENRLPPPPVSPYDEHN